MGATTTATKRGTATDGAQKRKRRRRNARTDVSSSSESSSSDDSDSESEAEEVEVEMKDAPAVTLDSDDSDGEDEEEGETAKGKAFTEKAGRMPSPLRELHDPEAEARFEEYYMRQLTSEFGDDLNAVRQARDFGEKSLPMLVKALRQGVNIFDTEEKRVVVGGGVQE